MIKSSVVNMDDRFNEVFPVFDPLNKEFFSGSRIINLFSNHFLFHPFKKGSDETFKAQLHLLNDLMISFLLDSSYTLVVTDISIKNNVTISIAYIYICDKAVTKMIHYTVNVLTTKAKLFAIKCNIN